MTDTPRSMPQPVSAPARRTWTLPRLAELPKLTALTLASAIGGGGGTGGGGSTVFTLLLAISALAACVADRGMPSEGSAMPRPVASITCTADVRSHALECGGPRAVGGREILGGQGEQVILRSTNVAYDNVTDRFTFTASVQNLTSQAIGSDGVSFDGIIVFFQDAPTATVGFGTITVDGASYGDFTGTHQPYYEWAGTFLPPGGTSGGVGFQFTVPGTVNNFAFTVLVAADVQDQGGMLVWDRIEGLSQFGVRSVSQYGASDAMAVGQGGVVEHWDGTSWVHQNSGTDEDFNDVVAVGPQEYIAVTEQGGVFRSKGKLWTKIHDNGVYPLRSIWLRDPTHFTAVGEWEVVTYSDGVFIPVTLPLTGMWIRAVGGTSDGSVIDVALEDGNIWRSTDGGANWALDAPLFAPVSSKQLMSMIYDADDQRIFAFVDFDRGVGSGVGGGIVRGIDDTLRSEADEYPYRLLAIGPDSLIAAISSAISGSGTLVKVRNSGAPVSFPITVDSLPGSIDRVTAGGPYGDEYFVVDFDSHFYRFTGGSFQTQLPSRIAADRDFWLDGDTLYVTDGTSALTQVVGDSAIVLPAAPYSFTKLWGSRDGATQEIMAIDGFNVYRRTGASAWSLEMMNPTPEPVFDIWGDASGPWLAVGGNGLVLAKEGGSWSVVYGPAPASYTAVWGCGTTAWITSAEGYLYRYEAGVVTEDASFTTLFGGPGPMLTAVAGSSCSDVFVGADGGLLLHFDGSVWSAYPSTISMGMIRAIWVRAPGEAYVGGDGGDVLLYTSPSGYTTIRKAAGSGVTTALWGRGTGELYAGGHAFLAHGRQ